VGPGPEGGIVLTVVVKATFEIHDGGARLAEEQLPIFYDNVEYDEDPPGRVRFENDLAPFKPLADVVVAGEAVAPGGRTVRQMQIGLRVGSLVRTLLVVGDRHWSFPSLLAVAPAPTRPKAFERMPITYDRAYGGVDAKAGRIYYHNPYGKGFAAKRKPSSLHKLPLPNIEDPRSRVKSWRSRPRPAGWGFYAPGWLPRMNLMGVDMEKGVLSGSFSFAFYNAAHPDLQIDDLRGDEEVDLRNLSEEGRLRFRLAGIRPEVAVTLAAAEGVAPAATDAGGGEAARADGVTIEGGVSGRTAPLEMKLDTLCLIPHERRYYQLWRGIVPVADLDASEVEAIHVALPGDASPPAGSP
jgi:hypothetical protein